MDRGLVGGKSTT